jgi:hypothetical protein
MILHAQVCGKVDSCRAFFILKLIVTGYLLQAFLTG